MPATIVAGVQWGDEGKGRIVDLLAAEADMVIRCQGGPNAGHTVKNSLGKFVLHSIPSGIFHDSVRAIIGPGTVINPSSLVQEIRDLVTAGIDVSRLLISNRAHVILPYHKALDHADEARRSDGDRVGTTGQGIGPAYADKAARCGIRAEDLLDPSTLKERIQAELTQKNRLLTLYGQEPLEIEDVLSEVQAAASFLAPYIGDTLVPISDALRSGRRVILEGQLGVMRDIDWGAYPFVTSSSPTPAGMAAGAGVPPQYVDRVIGIIKAYTTSVGNGPFPTELTDQHGAALREIGDEYGATTGRPRRCGWFDAVAAAWAARVAGFTELALTKLDVLDRMAEIPMCTAYTESGRVVTEFPTTRQMDRVQLVYELWPGWQADTTGARTVSDLPSQARAYVDEIQRRTGVPISHISVGPERDAVIRVG